MADSPRLTRLAEWYIRRRWECRGGRLVYVTDEGRVVDLGSYTVRELDGLASAVDVARRATPSTRERAVLSAYVHAAARMRAGLKKVAR